MTGGTGGDPVPDDLVNPDETTSKTVTEVLAAETVTDPIDAERVSSMTDNPAEGGGSLNLRVGDS